MFSKHFQISLSRHAIEIVKCHDWLFGTIFGGVSVIAACAANWAAVSPQLGTQYFAFGVFCCVTEVVFSAVSIVFAEHTVLRIKRC
jgi:hypothetical protein